MACMLALAGMAVCYTAKATTTPGELFDGGWKFQLDAPQEASEVGYDDSGWRSVDLPHDWSIEAVPEKDAPAGNAGGYYPTGVGWYRKTFQYKLSPSKQFLYFEGVYMNSEVYVNGQLAGGHPYGFTSFRVDITPYLKEGANTIAVKVDNSAQPNCRWYSGSGIYRHVWLMEEPLIHFEHQGTFVSTLEATPDRAVVRVQSKLINEGIATYSGNVAIVLRLEGKTVARIQVPVTSRPEQTIDICEDITIDAPHLWSPESPALYEASLEGGIATAEIRFGIRTIRWNSSEGFVLNGQGILLNGSCIHSDNGILGAAAFDAAEYRKARLLKDAGFNAVRTSHNPPAPAFLDACDELGLLVIDESFDGWREQKNPNDYSIYFDEWYKDDIQSMVRRDRNHPSVIMWSTGNEVIERKSIGVITTARRLSDAIREEDTTRPITSALASWDRDWEIYDPLVEVFEIAGYNYLIQHAEQDHLRDPRRVIAQTESYPNDAFRNWAYCQDNDYIIGDFVWTGLDYLGESGIGKYYYAGDPRNSFHLADQFPYHGAYCGDIDLTGWRKPISHYREMLWNGKEDYMYLCVREPDGYHGQIKTTGWAVYPTWESWEWPGWEGKPTIVEVYTKAPEVKLYLNDRLLGTKQVDRSTQFKAVFEVPYEPGTLRAEASGQTRILSTPGKPYAIRLSPEPESMNAMDVTFVVIEVIDRDGRICPDAQVELSVTVSGGSVQAVGNANLEDTGSYVDAQHTTWKGRALAVVRSSGKAGKCRLSVSSPGLRAATISIANK